MQLLLLLQRHLSSRVGTFVDIKTVSDFLPETSSPSISFSFSFSFSFQEPCWFQRTEPIPGNVHGSKCSFFSGRKNLSLASCCLFLSVWCSLGRGRFGKLRWTETVTKNSDFERSKKTEGSGCSTALEFTPHEREVMGLNPAGCWALSLFSIPSVVRP